MGTNNNANVFPTDKYFVEVFYPIEGGGFGIVGSEAAADINIAKEVAENIVSEKKRVGVYYVFIRMNKKQFPDIEWKEVEKYSLEIKKGQTSAVKKNRLEGVRVFSMSHSMLKVYPENDRVRVYVEFPLQDLTKDEITTFIYLLRISKLRITDLYNNTYLVLKDSLNFRQDRMPDTGRYVSTLCFEAFLESTKKIDKYGEWLTSLHEFTFEIWGELGSFRRSGEAIL